MVIDNEIFYKAPQFDIWPPKKSIGLVFTLQLPGFCPTAAGKT